MRYIPIIILSLISLNIYSQDLQYLIKPDNRFNSIGNYSESLAKVVITHDSATGDTDSTWESAGYIDTTGKLLFEKRVDDAGNFHCGLAYVSKKVNDSSKYGFIDKNGKEIIPCIYDEVENFSCNRAAVNKDGVWQIIDKSGKAIIGDSLLITERTVVDISANAEQSEDVEPSAFHNGLMLVRNNGKYGYADTAGKIIIPCKYYNALDFSNGVAIAAADTIDGSQNFKGNGYLDSLYNSLPSGETVYKWSVIDSAGKTLYNFKQNESPDLNQYFSEGYISFSAGRYRYGVINKNGKIIIPPKYENEPLLFSDGVTIVQIDDGEDDGNKNGYLLVMDTAGNAVAKIPFINRYGTMYDSRQQFHEGLMAVKMNSNWGYIDKKGNFIIPPQFSDALDFHDGCAVVVTDEGKVAVIKNPLKNIRK